jgi:hypothetical protein
MQMSVHYFSTYFSINMLSKMKATMGTKKVNTELLSLYMQIWMDQEDTIATNWKVREAKVLQAYEVLVIYMET